MQTGPAAPAALSGPCFTLGGIQPGFSCRQRPLRNVKNAVPLQNLLARGGKRRIIPSIAMNGKTVPLRQREPAYGASGSGERQASAREHRRDERRGAARYSAHQGGPFPFGHRSNGVAPRTHLPAFVPAQYTRGRALFVCKNASILAKKFNNRRRPSCWTSI